MSTPSVRGLRRPGRTPGAVNLGIVVALLALLLPLLLHAATSAPPTAAEFAPNAQQVIKKAPPGQAAVNGVSGTKTPPPPSASPSPFVSPSVLNVPQNLVKQCVGPPPLRQIEDPQSPPCIAYWKGDNGGATATGVTRDNIYIAVPTPENSKANFLALQNFFNKRFQFYGRNIVLEFCNSSGGGSGSSDQAGQNADAALAAAGCGGPKPFASTFYRTENGVYYMPEMGCKYHTIVLGSYSPYDSTFMNKCQPYLYQYPMVADEEFANIGEWACNRIVGRKAEWAGNGMSAGTRKFGILLEPFADDDPVLHESALDPITSRLHACGYDIPKRDIILNPVVGDYDPSSSQNAMLQLRKDGVTTVFCLCNFLSLGTIQRSALTDGYEPEWVTSTFGLSDVNSSFLVGASPGVELQRTFGVTFQPRIINPLLNPYNVAVTEGDPTIAPETTSTVEAKLEVYRALLVLAAGIQMAGPHLTVDSFRDGLRSTKFPNPITSIHAGAVDVPSNGYSYTSDGAEWWYSTTAQGPFSDSSAKKGTVCYLNGGRRYTLGSWPKGPGNFFSGVCDSGA